MDKNSLSVLRRELKSYLFGIRGSVIARNGLVPVCAICDMPFSTEAPDMHESIITRGDVRGNPKLSAMIMVKENCVLVHHGDCHIEAESKGGQRKCIRHLLLHESYTSIKTWLMSMDEAMKGSQAKFALNLLNEVYDEITMQALRITG